MEKHEDQVPRGFAIPRVHGRGAGLGNEMLVWAKAHIAAEVLGLKCLPPAFGLNKRGYSRYFGTSPLDWATHVALRKALPHFTLSEADHISSGSGDFVTTVEEFAASHNLRARPFYTLSLDGMWGGFQAIEPAREFIRAKLLASRNATANLFATQRKLKPGQLTVGFHIRRGDFAPPTGNDAYRGRFNVALPLDWYVNIARNLQNQFGHDINFLVVSDASSSALAPFGTEIPCHFTDEQNDRDISDLLALSACDLIVCSISSYSLWAAFLSSGRYVWPTANLTETDGFASIWGHETEQLRPNSPTRTAIGKVAAMTSHQRHGKGVAIDWHGAIPPELTDSLTARQLTIRRETDLLRYGVIEKRLNTGQSV